MRGRESPQRSLFGAHLPVKYLIPTDTFYDVLYRQSECPFSEDDFAAHYDLTTGRPSVPPSRTAKLLLLNTYENLSDQQVLERMAFDLRWKVVFGMEVGESAVGEAVHPLEAILQSARAAEHVLPVQALLKRRSAAERRLAYLMRCGLRQAHYCGRTKTEFQALATALVVNLKRLRALCVASPPLREERSAVA